MADATIVIAETNASVVVTSDTSATISVTETTANLTTSNVGIQGATGATGVVNVTSPITNSGTSTSAQLGLATAGTSGTYTKVTTDTFGRVTSGTTLSAGDIPTIAANQVTGTAYTMADYEGNFAIPTNTLDTIGRINVSAIRALGNGTVPFGIFVPNKNFTVSNITTVSHTSPATASDTGGTTVRRVGLYTYNSSNNTFTLVARTASDATLWSTASTAYTRALATTGGYPATYDLVKGTTYAIGCIAYNTGGTYGSPQIAATGLSGNSAINGLLPILSSAIATQTDLPTSGTAATSTLNILYARLT
jgi:hypothetical protein